ncbi:MAG: hypothetical protein ABR924_15985 [Terracidiphilus sp.]|jgi:hypothetical protein
MKNAKFVGERKFAGVDAEIGNRLIAMKPRVAALRSVRVALMQLAYALAERPASAGFLVLPDVSVTPERLRDEWRLASSVLRSDVLNRLSICTGEAEHLVGIPQDPDAETQRAISDLIAAAGPRASLSLARPEYPFTVMELLVHQWLLGKGPMTTKWLMETAGCSYPTVATVLRRFEHCLVRHSDRRVQLRAFPKEEWARLVAVSEKARGTVRFADRSGQPRSPDSLLLRLQHQDRKDIAVGGVVGARHYHPRLDIIGSPRLDISLHCPGKTADMSFIEKLDPALARTEKRDEPASVIVHLVRRADPLFQTGEAGLAWADPVECLFDLHEARLEPQAREFLNSFPTMKDQM